MTISCFVKCPYLFRIFLLKVCTEFDCTMIVQTFRKEKGTGAITKKGDFRHDTTRNL